MNLQDHIEYIRNRCIDAIAHGDKMDVADWRTGEGLSMSFNEAIEIVNEIDGLKAERGQLEKEKAELLDALKDAKSEIEWAAGCTFDSPIASKLKAAANKMVISIENAEKK